MTLTAVRNAKTKTPDASKRIDAARALLMLETAVVSRGATYVHPDPQMCRYAKYDAEFNEIRDHLHAEERAIGASCIVGEAFAQIGFTPEQLGRMDRMVGPFSNNQFEVAFPGWEVTNAAANMFRSAQIAQDKGHPWGFAYQQAMRVSTWTH